MKKSNITRISKKVFNFPTEASLALQLNKSLPSLAEFLDVCSSNPQYREFARELKDGPPSTTQNLKHRPHTKAPTKRLALLQDAYSDRNIKKHHHTVDTIDGSSLEASVNSPQKMREVLKKSGQGKNLGTGSNSKDSDCVKSSQLSKLALSKILGRTNQKSYWDKENREGPDMYDSQIDAGLESREETEEDPGRDPMKKAFKRLVKDRKKEDNSRSDNSKQKSKLRRSKLAFNDQALGERIALNSSQPHTTKHGSFSVLNSAGSPLYKPTINLTRRNTRVLMSQTRFPATTKHQKANNSLQVEHSQPQSKEREKEKHKKTYSISNSGTVPNSCSTLPKSSGSFIMKEAPKGHKKRGSILSKPQSDTDREAFMPFSTEHPRGLYQRVMTEKAVKLNGSGCEVLLSEPTTRHGEDSEQGSGQLFHGRQGEKFRWREEDTGRGLGSMDLESFARLEIAFGAFLEEHLRRFKGQISQEKMGKIVGSWNAFVNTLDVTEKDKDEEKENIEDKGEDAKKKRTPSEPGVKPRKEARSAGKVGTASQKKGRVSTSPNHISLLTGGKSFESKKASIAGDKSIDEFFMEKDKLQQIIQGQQNMIKTLKQNEDKMLKLLSAISRKGYDIEKVYREEIQAPEEEEIKQQQEQNVTDKLKEEDEKNEIEDSHITEEGIVSVLPEDSLLGESMDIPTPDMRSLKVAKNLSDTKSTTDSTPFPTGGTISHKRINSLLKHKLKLDLTGINPHANKVIVAGNGPMISKLNFGPIKENQQEGKEQRPGFHEEFMSKIEEFSLSWRQAAMNQRNF